MHARDRYSLQNRGKIVAFDCVTREHFHAYFHRHAVYESPVLAYDYRVSMLTIPLLLLVALRIAFPSSR